jgi:hypothetical protein
MNVSSWPEDCLLLPCYGCPLWARSRPWSPESERLISPKETLKTESREAENGTHRTPRELWRSAVIDPIEILSFKFKDGN